MAILNSLILFPEGGCALPFWSSLPDDLYTLACQAEYNSARFDEGVMLLYIGYTSEWEDEVFFVFSDSHGNTWTQTITLPIPF